MPFAGRLLPLLHVVCLYNLLIITNTAAVAAAGSWIGGFDCQCVHHNLPDFSNRATLYWVVSTTVRTAARFRQQHNAGNMCCVVFLDTTYIHTKNIHSWARTRYTHTVL